MSHRRNHQPRMTSDRRTSGQTKPLRLTSADRRVLRRLMRDLPPGTMILSFVRPADVWW